MDHQDFASCIAACNACADACDRCAAACLEEADAKRLSRCIALDIDCAQVCRMTASLMARGSDLASYVCKSCEEMCEACAEECARHAMDHCRECAEACRRCAEECRRMAANLPGKRATEEEISAF